MSNLRQSIDDIKMAILEAERNLDLSAQSARASQDALIAERVALGEERKDHSVTRDALRAVRIQLDSLTNERVGHNTELVNGWARLAEERTKLIETNKPSRIMRDLAENNERATKKHGPHVNIMVTLGVLSQEMHELQDAVHSREERLMRAELLDVATGALRGVEALDERAEVRRKPPYRLCPECAHIAHSNKCPCLCSYVEAPRRCGNCGHQKEAHNFRDAKSITLVCTDCYKCNDEGGTTDCAGWR